MIHHELNLIRIITGISLPDDLKIYIQALILTSILNIPEICRTFRKVEFNHFNMCAKGENILERIVALQKECTRTYWLLSVLTTKNCCKWGQFCVTQPSVYFFFFLSIFIRLNGLCFQIICQLKEIWRLICVIQRGSSFSILALVLQI